MTTHERAAAILIDLQAEFLTSTGFFKRPVDMESLLEPIELLTVAAREATHPVIWVRSEHPEREVPPEPLRPPRPEGARYAELPANNDRLAGGHAGSPCCVPGSAGAQFPDAIAKLVADKDLHLIKDRYSAFGETDLLETLRARGVEVLYICGVETSTSVRATAVDAFFHGFEVVVVEDAVGASRPQLHRDALQALGRYAGVHPVCVALTRWKSVRRGLGAGDTSVWYGVLPDEIEETIHAEIRDEIAWEEMRHRGGVVPRLIALHGTIEEDGTWPLYRHPADEQPTLVAWTPRSKMLAELAESLLDQPLNHALIQRYVDGSAYISDHADKTLDIERGAPIVGLSLGATRAITLRSKDRDDPVTQRLELPHGSLFVLGWETNQTFQHGIRRDRRTDGEKRADELREGGERISLTMRSVATYMTPDGIVYGQGARRDSATDPDPPEVESIESEAQRMLDMFGLENRSDDFDWDAAYGEGFDVEDLGALNDAPSD